MKIETRRRISAFFLLAVMLSMLMGVSLHHHEHQASVEETCADCLHHVHHAGHLTAQTVDFHECVLCLLHSLPYLMPSILHLAIAICIIHAVYGLRGRCPWMTAPSLAKIFSSYKQKVLPLHHGKEKYPI